MDFRGSLPALHATFVLDEMPTYIKPAFLILSRQILPDL